MGRVSNIVIGFAYVRAYHCRRSVRPAIETLPGLYLNRFAGRYECPFYTALCSLDGLERAKGEEDTGRSCRIRILYYRALEAPAQVYR